MTVIGYLHGNKISKMIASDINEEVLIAAKSNLSLLMPDGLNRRMDQLREMILNFGKNSHHEALQSASRLDRILQQHDKKIDTHCFQLDFLADSNFTVLKDYQKKIHLVMTDVPYGEHVDWVNDNQYASPLETLLDRLLPLLAEPAVVAVIANKSQKLRHDRYQRLEYARVGKRHFAIFTPLIN